MTELERAYKLRLEITARQAKAMATELKELARDYDGLPWRSRLDLNSAIVQAESALEVMRNINA